MSDGNFKIISISTAAGYISDIATSNINARPWGMRSNTDEYGDFSIIQGNTKTSNPLLDGTNRLHFNSLGNVGIGYSTGTEITNNKLAVNGSIYGNTTLTINGLASTNARLLSTSSTGLITPIVDGSSGQVLTTNGSGVYGFTTISSVNTSVQPLSGTTPTWNAASGTNAKLTLVGATTITMSNLISGTGGYLDVTNGNNINYFITFSGYTIRVTRGVWKDGDRVYVSGGTKLDVYHWSYNGTEVIISGTLDVQ